MNLNHLAIFHAVALAGSVSGGAKRLHISQSAVSKQLGELETALDLALFERLPRSLRLTEKGAAYLPPLRNSFDELAAATAGLFGPVGKRTLTIRAPISFMVLWLAPRLTRFSQQWPDISLRISTVVWAPSASDDLADIDIRFGDGNWPGFQSTILIRQPAVPVCTPGMAKGEDDISRLKSLLASAPLIHVTGYENLWQKLIKPLGLTLPSTAGMNIDTTVSALEMAAAGLGPAIIQHRLAEPYLRDGRLVRPVDMAIPIEESHYIVLPEGQKRLKAEAILFRDWLFKETAL